MDNLKTMWQKGCMYWDRAFCLAARLQTNSVLGHLLLTLFGFKVQQLAVYGKKAWVNPL